MAKLGFFATSTAQAVSRLDETKTNKREFFYGSLSSLNSRIAAKSNNIPSTVTI